MTIETPWSLNAGSTLWEAPVSLATAPPIGGAPNGGGQTQGEPGAGPGGAQPGGGQPPSPFGGGGFLLFIFLLFIFLIVMQALSGRKQKKQRNEMLSSLDRHDRVQTVGGVIGTITDVRGDEITLKVDESTNTKIRFARSAVQTVLKKAGGGGSEASEPQEVQETINA